MAATVLLLPVPTRAQSHASTRVRPAPRCVILDWINGDGDNVDKLRRKVIIIDFFELWCPGCNKFSGPLMKHGQQKFASEVKQGSLKFVTIHTVFDGHNYQTVKRFKNCIREKEITTSVEWTVIAKSGAVRDARDAGDGSYRQVWRGPVPTVWLLRATQDRASDPGHAGQGASIQPDCFRWKSLLYSPETSNGF